MDRIQCKIVVGIDYGTNKTCQCSTTLVVSRNDGADGLMAPAIACWVLRRGTQTKAGEYGRNNIILKHTDGDSLTKGVKILQDTRDRPAPETIDEGESTLGFALSA
ncbi:uncharacterized protein BJX67DRAFT_378199 [Aspergillus lucknowensis]|uniref:Actin-like ATPase domain-containing protein n=1 Tax=Aspergillus lucknowensis TaxID=176173 RepID=A0ABR4M2T2_9EURO